MTEFGKTLRAAREAKGLSVAQLAEMTHMTPARVEELETENFTGIPAAIYGRGFVRLYCGAVGLDPKPLADEFTDIFNGNRDPEIRERAPEPEPIPTAREELTREELTRSHGATETSDTEDDSMDLATRPATSTSVPPCLRVSQTSEERTPTPSEDLFAEPTTTSVPHPSSDRLRGSLCSGDTSLRVSNSTLPASEEPASGHGPTLSRYAAPLHDRPKLAVPPSVWRLALLGCAALLVLWALAVGVRALYRATGGAPGEVPPAESAPTEMPPPEAKAETRPTPPAGSRPADGPRTPQSIPALYID